MFNTVKEAWSEVGGLSKPSKMPSFGAMSFPMYKMHWIDGLRRSRTTLNGLMLWYSLLVGIAPRLRSLDGTIVEMFKALNTYSRL